MDIFRLCIKYPNLNVYKYMILFRKVKGVLSKQAASYQVVVFVSPVPADI